MEINVISRTGKAGRKNSSVKAAAYIDAEKYIENSSLAAGAYISGSVLENVKERTIVDYTKKTGVLFSEVLLPENAPKRFYDPEMLWNEVENISNRKNAELFREFIVSLDQHLSEEDRYRVAKEFGLSLCSEGMCVHYSIHDEKAGNGNYHIHFLTPVHSIKEDGTFEKRKYYTRHYLYDKDGNKIPVIDKRTGEQRKNAAGEYLWKMEPIKYVDAFNDKKLGNAERWRNRFAEIENKYLPEEFQVNPVSYEKQGIDKIPQRCLSKAEYNFCKNLERKVKKLPEEKRAEYLLKVTEQIKREYREVYYANSRNSTKAKREADSVRNDLELELQEELFLHYKNKPKCESTSFYSKSGRERVLVEWALISLIKLLKYLIKKRTWENKKQDLINIKKLIYALENDILIVFTYGVTGAVENHLLKSEYEAKKTLLKELGEEIKSLEEQIKNVKENKESYEELTNSIGTIRDRINAIERNREEGNRNSGVDAITEEVERACREVEQLAGWIEEAERNIAKSGQHIAETGRHITTDGPIFFEEGMLDSKKKIGRRKSL